MRRLLGGSGGKEKEEKGHEKGKEKEERVSELGRGGEVAQQRQVGRKRGEEGGRAPLVMGMY